MNTFSTSVQQPTDTAVPVSELMSLDDFQFRGVRVGETYINEFNGETHTYVIKGVDEWSIDFDYTDSSEGILRSGWLRRDKLTEYLYCWGYSLIYPEDAQ